VGQDLCKNFGEKVPLSVTYPGIVDGKEYIITCVDLTEGTPVHNIPAEYKGYIRVTLCWSTIGLLNHHVSDAEINNACILGALFRAIKNIFLL
jgi:hypothetical protein